MQSVGHRQHEPHAQHQRAPPRTTARRGGRIMLIRPILARIHATGSAHHGQQHEEQCAHAIEPQMQRFAAQQESAPPFPIPCCRTAPSAPRSARRPRRSAVRASQVRESREPTTTPVARVTKASSKSGPGVMASPPVWKRPPTRHPPRQPPERFLRPSHSLRSARAAARGQGCG